MGPTERGDGRWRLKCVEKVFAAVHELALMAAALLVARGPPIRCHPIKERHGAGVLCSAVQTAPGNSPNSVILCKYFRQTRPL
jgi:hypothetical protein